MQKRRWISIVSSRSWYWIAPLQAIVAWLQLSRIHYLLDTVVLGVGTLLLLTPSVLYPDSLLARGWRIMAISWATLMVRQMLFIFLFDSTQPRPWWMDAALVIIYVPGIVMMAQQFYLLPFQRRSRLSLFLDCGAIGFASTITIAVVLSISISDLIFITGNMVVLFAGFNIYQQAKDDLRQPFKAISLGLISLILSDSVWLYFKINDISLIWMGPVYTIAWLNFTRSALIVPQTQIDYDETNPVYVPPLQDALGTLTLLMCSFILLLRQQSNLYILAFVGFAMLIRYIEAIEYQRVHTRLNDARKREGQLRTFLQSIGHDLKTPINALALMIGRVRHYDSPLSNSLVEQHSDLKRRVMTMLDVARTMNDSLVIEPISSSNLKTSINEIWGKITFIYGQTIEFTLDCSTNVRFYADYQTLKRAIENILINAVKVLISNDIIHPHVVCCIEHDAVSLTITIEDNGPGFSPQFLQKRIAQSPLGYDGTGLGLTGVFASLTAMGGNVTLNNAIPGALVCLYLPLDRG